MRIELIFQLLQIQPDGFLFENALKYNEITHRYPLDIDIYAEVGAVIVENSYHPRTDNIIGIFYKMKKNQNESPE